MADVIVVEDDQGALRALHRVVSRLGHQVRGFSEPTAAIQSFKHRHADVLVTDWDLNHVHSGINVALHALAERPTTQIILITGKNISQLKDQSSDMPNTRCMAKPFNLCAIKTAIDEASKQSN